MVINLICDLSLYYKTEKLWTLSKINNNNNNNDRVHMFHFYKVVRHSFIHSLTNYKYINNEKKITWIPSFKFDFNEVHLCGAFMSNVRVRYVVLNLSELLETARYRRTTFLATPLLFAISPTLPVYSPTHTSPATQKPGNPRTPLYIKWHIHLPQRFIAKVRDCTKIRVHLTGGKHF